MAKKVDVQPLTPAEIATGPDGAVAKQHGLRQGDAALVLHPEGGAGPPTANGSARLARASWPRCSLVWCMAITIVPGSRLAGRRLCRPRPGTFTMTDLLQFVGDISPIDGITTVATL